MTRDRFSAATCFLPRLLASCALIVALATPAVRGASAPELHATLDQFTGEWEGEMQIHALDGFLLKTFPVERSYSWDGDVQVVETKFSDGFTDFETTARQDIQLGRLHSIVSRQGFPPEEFSGEATNGEISWTNVGRNSRDYKERISQRDGVRTIETTSFEITRVKSLSGLVRINLIIHPKAGVAAATPGGNAESTALAARVADLEKKLAAAGAAEKSATAQAQDAARERDALRTRLADADAETQRLNARVAALETERKNLEARAASAGSNSDQSAQLAATTRDLQTARADADAARQQAEKIQTERDALTAQLAAAGTRTNDLQTKLAAIERDRAQASEAAEKAARDNQDLQRRIQQLEGERQSLAASLDEAKKNAAAAATASPAAQSSNTAAEIEVAALRAELSRAKADAESAMRQAEKLQTDRDALNNRVVEAERALAVSSDAGRETSELRTKISAQDAELADLRAKLARAGTDAAALQRTAEQAAADRDKLATQLANAEKRAQAAAAQSSGSDDLRRQIAEATTARDRATAQVADLSRQLDAARADLEKARSGATSESERVQQLQRDLAAATSARSAQDTELRRIQDDLAAANKRAADLDAGVKRAEAAAADSARALAQAKTDNEALAKRADAAAAENTRLAARVKELDTAVAAAEEARRANAGATSASETERAALRDQVAGLQRDIATAKAAADDLRRERETLAARVTQFEARADISTTALEAERRAAQERFQSADAERLEAIGRAADLEKQLAAATGPAAADLQNQLSRARADADAAMRQAEKIQTERDALAARLTDAERSAADALAARDGAKSDAADAAKRADASDARVRELEASAAVAASLRSDLEAQRKAVAQLQKDNDDLTVRLDGVTRERTQLAARIADLEAHAKNTPAVSAPASADAAGASDRKELFAEIERLERRVLELESDRNSIRDSQAVLQSQLDQAKRLRDDTLSRFDEVVTQLNAIREERDRLARANVSLQAEVRAARSTASPSETNAVPRPSAMTPAQRTIDAAVAAYQIIGATHASDEDKVIIDGRVFRNGDLVDPGLGITFEKIDGNTLLFKDTSGHSYRRRF